MSKFAIGAQAEHVVDGRRSATTVLCAIDESAGDAVEIDSRGIGRPVTGAKLTFMLTKRGAA